MKLTKTIKQKRGSRLKRNASNRLPHNFPYVLYVKPEKDDISVFHDIILALAADKSLFLRGVH